MEKTRIVIVDDNIEFLEILSKFFSQRENFDVVGTAADGLEAVALIKEKQPDVVILDIMMPKLDGLGVLEKNRSTNKKTQYIITSAIGHFKTTQIALSLGAEYFMIKPFDFEDLVSRIGQLQSVDDEEYPDPGPVNPPCVYGGELKDVESHIAKILDEVGVPTHLKGYEYLKHAIGMVVKDLTAINSITKLIYTDTAKKFQTTRTRVERSIRNAIEITWTKGDIEKINTIFKYELSANKTRPSNSEFIVMVANKIWDKSSSAL